MNWLGKILFLFANLRSGTEHFSPAGECPFVFCVPSSFVCKETTNQLPPVGSRLWWSRVPVLTQTVTRRILMTVSFWAIRSKCLITLMVRVSFLLYLYITLFVIRTKHDTWYELILFCKQIIPVTFKSQYAHYISVWSLEMIFLFEFGLNLWSFFVIRLDNLQYCVMLNVSFIAKHYGKMGFLTVGHMTYWNMKSIFCLYRDCFALHSQSSYICDGCKLVSMQKLIFSLKSFTLL